MKTLKKSLKSLPKTIPSALEQKHEPSKSQKSTKNRRVLLSSGCSTLNLACSDAYRGAFPIASMTNLIGDSSSGKTQLVYSALAEACNNSDFDDYDLYYDGAEARDFFDIQKMYGCKLWERLRGSTGIYLKDKNEEDKYYSSDTDEFEVYVDKALKKGNCIYVLDSADALCPPDSDDEFKKKIKKVEKNAEVSGSYGMAKAKAFSNALQRICSKLENTKSILIIISQTRENIDKTSFSTKTRAGGKALKFYAVLEIWLATKEHIKKEIKGKKLEIGQIAIAKITKNNLTGKVRTAEFPIYYDYGIDDLGSCFNYLKEFEEVKKEKNTYSIDLVDETLSGSQDSIIRQIESDNDLIRALKKKTQDVWLEIESKVLLNRAKKYE